jgi:hypothetical protein
VSQQPCSKAKLQRSPLSYFAVRGEKRSYLKKKPAKNRDVVREEYRIARYDQSETEHQECFQWCRPGRILFLTMAKMSPAETRKRLLFERACIEQPQDHPPLCLEIASEKETEQYIANSQALPSKESKQHISARKQDI